MRTDKQNQASKANGAKSKGPRTTEGKARAARNAATHNLCTGHLVLLSNEEPRDFDELQHDYLTRFLPIDGVETDLVNKMIAATWREKRVTAMETALFELEMIRQQHDVDDQYLKITAAARQALALFGTEDTKSAAALLYRYGSTARRAYTSAFRALKELQGDRFNKIPANRPEAGPNVHPEVAPRRDAALSGATAENATEAASQTMPMAVVRRPMTPNNAVSQATNPAEPSTQNNELRNEPKRAMAAGKASPSWPFTMLSECA